MLGDDAQNNETNVQYADVIKTGESFNLLPWKTKKTGRRKRKNGPDIPTSGHFVKDGGISGLTECSVRQHLDNQVNVEVVEDENGFIARSSVVFHLSGSLVGSITVK